MKDTKEDEEMTEETGKVDSWVHPGWFEPFDPDKWAAKKAWVGQKELKRGLEERRCEECEFFFMPETPAQVICGGEGCRRQRIRRLTRERAREKAKERGHW